MKRAMFIPAVAEAKARHKQLKAEITSSPEAMTPLQLFHKERKAAVRLRGQTQTQSRHAKNRQAR